jgi:adenylate kinase
VINVLGLAGSGKTTQGQLLAKKLNCPWISMGELLRAKGDQSVRADIEAGRIVNDSITLAILDEDLKAKQADKKECVVDGWPRAINQADWLINKAKHGQIKITVILHLKAHSQIARERILKRHRQDDTEQAINQRFKDYHETIVPILKHLEAAGLPVVEINADAGIDEVERQIDKVLARR